MYTTGLLNSSVSAEFVPSELRGLSLQWTRDKSRGPANRNGGSVLQAARILMLLFNPQMIGY